MSIRTARCSKRFAEAEADFVLYGHTHHQLVRRVGRVLVINPGSAGEARDSGNGRQLSCAVLDTVTDEVVVTNFPDIPRCLASGANAGDERGIT